MRKVNTFRDLEFGDLVLKWDEITLRPSFKKVQSIILAPAHIWITFEGGSGAKIVDACVTTAGGYSTGTYLLWSDPKVGFEQFYSLIMEDSDLSDLEKLLRLKSIRLLEEEYEKSKNIQGTKDRR